MTEEAQNAPMKNITEQLLEKAEEQVRYHVEDPPSEDSQDRVVHQVWEKILNQVDNQLKHHIGEQIKEDIK